MSIIAGVDEAGRGPLAGPVVAACVILDAKYHIDGLKDSKKLSEKKRNELFALIKQHSIAWSVGSCDVTEIDEINILQASLVAMQRAVANLKVSPNEVWIDGNVCPKLPFLAKSFIGGDNSIEVISAASIVAKVTRDKQMYELHDKYPEYRFDKHKGYGTRVHMEAMAKFGITSEHRRSFKPVSQYC
ncbi:MAG: ribonuclease HII [Thiotrichales bacterium]|nr:MAG: ribonuclease HII [Thiotrichales bacterium]